MTPGPSDHDPGGAAPGCVLCGATGSTTVRPYRSIRGHEVFDGLTVERCSGCSLEAAAPMPSQEVLDAYYAAAAYDSGKPELAAGTSLWTRLPRRADAQLRMVRSLHPGPIRSWLDLGSGYGKLLDAARRSGVERTAAIESTPARRQHLESEGHEVFDDLDAARAQAPAGRWDVVSISHVLEHVADPVGMLDALGDCLADGGALFCEVPNAAAWAGPHDDPHVTFLSPATLGAIIGAASLTPVDIRTAGAVVTRHRIRRGIETKVWGLAERLGPPQRFARLHPDYRTSPDGRLVVRAVARR